MPKGTPHVLKCPKCKCGKHGYGPSIDGCRATGLVERKVSSSKASGSGAGGSRFVGHRGQVKCRDCGHSWFSTHPQSGRVSSWDIKYKGAVPKFVDE